MFDWKKKGNEKVSEGRLLKVKETRASVRTRARRADSDSDSVARAAAPAESGMTFPSIDAIFKTLWLHSLTSFD